MVEAWLPAGKLKALFERAGFAGEDVREEGVPVEAWWGSVEEAAKCIAQVGRESCSSAPALRISFGSTIGNRRFGVFADTDISRLCRAQPSWLPAKTGPKSRSAAWKPGI